MHLYKSLFELLARRYTKVVEKHSVDITVYEDLLVLLLEIINSTLTHRLKHNSQLVYAMLQKREIFTPFQSHPRFSDLVQNVEQVIHHFNARVSEANLKAPSSNEVLRLIEQASRTWSNQKLIVSTLNQEKKRGGHTKSIFYDLAVANSQVPVRRRTRFI